MLNSNRDTIMKAAGKFENQDSPTRSYKEGSHPVEIYVTGDRGYRADVLFNNIDVIGFLYVYEDILTKAFLVKRYTNFSTGARTITAVSGSCFKYTPFRMYDKQVLADVLLFSSDKVDELFPSVGVGDFLTKDANKASAGLYPKLPGHMENYRVKARINSMPWLLPLISGNKVIEGPVSDDAVMESLSLDKCSILSYLRLLFDLSTILLSTSAATPILSVESLINDLAALFAEIS